MRRIKNIIRNIFVPFLQGRARVGLVLFILSFLHFFITSCSSDQDEPEVKQTPIAFSANQQEEEVTRAGNEQGLEELLPEGKKKFTVWGYKNMSETSGDYGDLQVVIPGYIVNWVQNSAGSSTTNSHDWDYANGNQTIKYWDFEAKAYRFYAVAVVDETNHDVTTAETDGHKNIFTMAADASSETEMNNTPFFTRLWFSDNNASNYPTRLYGQPVTLEFIKPYSRVRFMFTYSYSTEGIKIRSKSFRPSDSTKKIIRKGTVTITYPLTGTATKESFSMTPATGENTGALTEFTEEYIPNGGALEVWYNVLPNDTQGSYTMYVRMNNDSQDKTAVVPAEYMKWLPGYSYTYIFKITEEGGVEIDQVLSAFTPWTEVQKENLDIYNW